MIRLVIADDHPVVREGFARIVEAASDVRVVGEAANGDELFACLERNDADVLLLDISMPGPTFLEMMEAVRERWPDVKVLIVSAHPEDQYAVRALKVGAMGYLTKERSPDELVSAIRQVHRGGRYITPSLAEQLASRLSPTYEAALHDSLSERELRVVALLGQGRGVKEIAAAMKLSPKTVSTYRRRALDKLRLETTADIIRYAIEHGLTP